MSQAKSEVSSKHLVGAQAQLRIFQKQKKVRVAGTVALAAVKLKKMLREKKESTPISAASTAACNDKDTDVQIRSTEITRTGIS
jgi:hypothetical protein